MSFLSRRAEVKGSPVAGEDASSSNKSTSEGIEMQTVSETEVKNQHWVTKHRGETRTLQPQLETQTQRENFLISSLTEISSPRQLNFH